MTQLEQVLMEPRQNVDFCSYPEHQSAEQEICRKNIHAEAYMMVAFTAQAMPRR